MRKIMMAALFSVISLSACAVEDPQQADPANATTTGDTVVETAGEQGQQLEPVEAQPTKTPGQRDVNAQGMDEQSMVSCDGDDDCESTRCDLETHHCRAYPF
jgi:hypothetical protein